MILLGAVSCATAACSLCGWISCRDAPTLLIHLPQTGVCTVYRFGFCMKLCEACTGPSLHILSTFFVAGDVLLLVKDFSSVLMKDVSGPPERS